MGKVRPTVALTSSDIEDNAVTSSKIIADAVTTAKINDGDVTTAKMATNPTNASNLASGTVGSARMGSGTASSSTVLYGDGTWKAEPVTNTSGLRNDISTLALHSAIADNKAAFNLTNAFIDQYEDSSGIDTSTDAVRSSSEYMTTVLPGVLQSSMTVAGGAYNTQVSDQAGTNQTLSHSGSGSYVGGLIKHLYPLGAQDSRIRVYRSTSGGVPSNSLYNVFGVVVSEDTDLNYTDMPGTASFDFYGQISSTGNRDTLTTADTVTRGLGVTSYSSSWSSMGNTSLDLNSAGQIVGWYQNSGSDYSYGWECFYDASANTIKFYQGITGVTALTGAFTATKESTASLTLTEVPTTGYFYVTFGEASGPDYAAINGTGITMDSSNGVQPLANASGNYTSTTETANATVSKMGVVVLYKNEAGTATLDTDLIVQVSADGGSNYVSAPLTAAGTFSTGILSAKSNDITISNTGTAPKYKVSFANQSAGVKETQVHGIALLY
jgi:hypothetical protein